MELNISYGMGNASTQHSRVFKLGVLDACLLLARSVLNLEHLTNLCPRQLKTTEAPRNT